MKKLLLATLAVVLFGGVVFASECGDWAGQQTNNDEAYYGCMTSQQFNDSVCDYYNHCISH
jgi:hypothetical protein